MSETSHPPAPEPGSAPDTSFSALSTPAPLSFGTFTPGTYVLLNVRSGLALDMSGMDFRSVIGYPQNGGTNQQWEFSPSIPGPGYTIRCIRPAKEGHSLYITNDASKPVGQASIITTPTKIRWEVELTGTSTIRITTGGRKYALEHVGRTNLDQKMGMAYLTPAEPSQLWYLRAIPGSPRQ